MEGQPSLNKHTAFCYLCNFNYLHLIVKEEKKLEWPVFASRRFLY